MISPRCQVCGAYATQNDCYDVETVFDGKWAHVHSTFRCPKCGKDIVLTENYEKIAHSLRNDLNGAPMVLRATDGYVVCPNKNCGRWIWPGPTMIYDLDGTVMETHNDCTCPGCRTPFTLEEVWKRRDYDVKTGRGRR